MKYLLKNIHDIDERIHASKRIILLTDYDGTLTPIRESPDLAILSEEVRQLLVQFSSHKTFFLGIITGRSLKQIKKLVNIQKILYVANHGVEVEGPGVLYTSSEAQQSRYVLKHIYSHLLKSLRDCKGIYIEDKGLSLSFHYRAINNADDIQDAIGIFNGITKPFLDRKMIFIVAGKMVYEIRPPVKWNKASTIQWLLGEYFHLPYAKDTLLFYMGDDKPDIEVFSSLKGSGVTIFVGNPSDTSEADYYVNSPEEVKVFLEHLYEQKNEVHNECHL